MEVLSSAASIVWERFRPGHDEFWMAFCPVAIYWVLSIFYDMLDHSSHPFIAKHRVTRKTRGRENPIGRGAVVMRVLLQHLLQTLMGMLAIVLDPGQCSKPPVSLGQSCVQFVLGMFIMDTWQYWIHRWMHVNTWLYKQFHSTHHQLLIPYAYGALYNHPLEAIVLDTVGAGVSMYAAGMSCKLATVFFTFSTAKTVLDHCSYRFPINPLHDLFPNSAAYHDVHHDIRGIKKNFSQPYFTHWDMLMGTYLDPTEFHLSQKELSDKVDKETAKAAAAASGQKSPIKKSPAKEAAAASSPLKSPAKRRTSGGLEEAAAAPASPAAAGKDTTPGPSWGTVVDAAAGTAAAAPASPRTVSPVKRRGAKSGKASAASTAATPGTTITTRSRARQQAARD